MITKSIRSLNTLRWQLLPLLLLLVVCSYGQTQLQGTIIDEKGEPVSGATLTVQNQRNGAISSFALSSDKGEYTVELAAGSDTLWFTVSHLSHASQEKIITDRPERLDWQLETEAFQLPELVLNVPAVTRKGDTLVFDVNQLKGAMDENIEQVLARIPGITIESNGRILYQDLPISKFYIEGLDLLEGRYALATRNLNVESIRDIEILEEHQPILALDSLIMPPNAAINLRLKSQVVFTGEIEAGGGVAPGLYLGSGSLFGFQKRQQFNVLGTINNVGEQLSNNFKSLYGELNFDQQLVNPTVILPPWTIANTNALDNKEMTGGFNYLRKINATSQLKIQAYTTNEDILYRGTKDRTLRDENAEQRFFEILDAENSFQQLNGRLIYELNKKKVYTNLYIEAEKGKTATDVNNLFSNQITNISSFEDFTKDDLLLRGRWQSIFRKGNKAYRLWSKVDYREITSDLELRPLDVLVSNDFSEPLERAAQVALERKLNADIYTSFIMRRKQLIGRFKYGLRTHWHRINSDLAALAADGSSSSLGALFVNAINNLRWAPYHEQDYRWEQPKGEWKLSLPISFHQLNVQDDLSTEELKRGLLVTRPELEYMRNLKAENSLTAKFSFSRDYNQEQLFYNNYLLRSNRQFDQQTFQVNQRNIYEFSLRYLGKNSNTGLYHNSHVSLSQTKADLINTTVFNSSGEATLLAANTNVQRRLRFQNQLEIVPWSAFQIKLESNYSFFLRPSILNGNAIDIQIQQAWVEPYFAYTVSKTVLSLRPRFDIYASNISDNTVWQSQLQWVIFHQFNPPLGSIRVSFNQYRTTIGPTVINNQLLNLRYKTKIPALKLDVSLHVNNLTDANDFVTFTQQSFSEEVQHFRLRPRQVFLRLERKF